MTTPPGRGDPEPFGRGYAGQYDLLYSDKEYEGECDLLEEAFRRLAPGPVRSVLDLGCGTGSHSIPLARRGYRVVGVDRSQEMLALAERKAMGRGLVGAEGQGPGVSFRQGDVRSLDLGEAFDAALMMFAVLGYQLENADVLAALRTARQHLSAGGLMAADVWYGPAVLALRPSDRVKVIPTGDGKLIRLASGETDVRRHLCRVSYRLWRIAGDRVAAEAEETHLMRFFFPMELELLLESAGFRLARLSAFGDLDRPADEGTWNVLVVARAVDPEPPGQGT